MSCRRGQECSQEIDISSPVGPGISVISRRHNHSGRRLAGDCLVHQTYIHMLELWCFRER